MAHSFAHTPAASDGPRKAGGPWRQALEGRFVWDAPLPSPAEVSELVCLFPDIIQVPVQSLKREVRGWGQQAVLAHTLSRWIPPEAIVRELHRAGVPGDVEAISLTHRHYIFRFNDPRAKDLVLGRPWVVNGQVLVVAEWHPDFIPAADSLLQALIWIWLPHLPLEYWTEEVFSSILSVAGEFLYSDDSTKARSRGTYARVCVCVDLGHPLRPGARIQGIGDPFWQQFSYENIEGICPLCGSLHPGRSCELPVDQASSSTGPKFGPWMAALQHRRPIQDQILAPRMEVQPNSASSISMDGWQLPKKTARHQTASKKDLGTERGGRASSSSTVLTDQRSMASTKDQDVVRGGRPSPPFGCVVGPRESSACVPADTEGELCSESLKPDTLRAKISVGNPFYKLGSGIGSGCPKSCLDTKSGPSKRARPVEPLTQRVVSRSSKAKGKAPLTVKGRNNESFTFLASSDRTRGTGALSSPGTKKSRCKLGPDLGIGLDTIPTDQLAGRSHEFAVL